MATNTIHRNDQDTSSSKTILGKTVFQSLKYSALDAAVKSPFYDWTLSSKQIPHQLAVKLIDPWPGNPEAARQFCKGQFSFEESLFPVSCDLWTDYGDHPTLRHAIHSFAFLRDLKAMGGDIARKMARDHVMQWMERYDRFDHNTWSTCTLSERLYFWLTSYDFFGASAGNQFQQRYFDLVIRQARHLSRTLTHDNHGIALLRAARGLIYAGLSFAGREQWVMQGFNVILHEIPKQILSDGGHVSRSPTATADTLQIMFDIRCALRRSDLPVPEIIQHAIDRLGQAFKFFRGHDKKLPLFHGSREGDICALDSLYSQIPVSNRIVKSLPETGFERVQMGRCLMMIDACQSPMPPLDRTSHSSPLAFELSYGRERVFVNCGSHPTSAEWKQILRHTAAHNTLTINHAPAHDILPNGSLARRHDPVRIKRVDDKDSCLLEMQHNAWQAAHGMTHKRRLYISDQGLDIRGEDTLSSDLAPEDALDVTLRFHLHPRVLVSLVQEGQEALLRLPSGLGFRFFSVGGTLSLENSIYVGTGLKPIKTKQLVVTTRMIDTNQQLKWALQRE